MTRSSPSALIRAYEGRARRRFGQHFLVSETVIEKTAAAVELGPGDHVLEIGPGLGVLTDALLATEAQVLAVELDRNMAAFLRNRLGDHPRFTLIEADAAKVDWAPLLGDGRWRHASNLPYNVGTRILTELLGFSQIDRHVVMLQREVAQRVLAPAGHRQRSSLGLFVEARAEASQVCKVPPGAFRPPPKVHSAVVRLDCRPHPDLAVSPQALERLGRKAFASPRKTIRNNLRQAYGGSAADAALQAAEVLPGARPGTLPLGVFSALARALEPE